VNTFVQNVKQGKKKIFSSGQNRQKSSLEECGFINLALKIQCYIVKNTLLQSAFSMILPTGLFNS